MGMWLSHLPEIWQKKLFPSASLHRSNAYLEVNNNIRYLFILFFSLAVFLSAFIFDRPSDILSGIPSILTVPGVLVTDYMAVANIGTALFNAGLLMLICIGISRLSQIVMDGPVIAAIFTVGGFALFGKNMINIWPIFAGVWLYARYRQRKFGQFILPALFGTALSPVVSQIAFGFDLPDNLAYFLAIAVGLVVGFALPPLANHFVVFHQGFNLYNIGFTSGIIGMAVMSLFRAFNHDVAESTMIVSAGNNTRLSIWLVSFFTLLLLAGLMLTNKLAKGLGLLFKQGGRLVTDFVSIAGFGPSLINMALLGYLSTGYILLVGGELNGPTIGGVFTVVGFGAFGKHLLNVTPLFIGVFLASMLKIFETNSTGALLAALFGTTLAPLAGAYGWTYGIAAGFVHMSVVMNVGYLHGGMNLYNNGFAGGFVAATLVPLFDVLKNRFITDDEKPEAEEA